MKDLLAEISRLETELHHPGVGCTRDRLDALLHADFFEVARSGRKFGRDYVMDFLAEHSPPAVHSDDFQLTSLAEGCVLLNYRSVQLHPDGSRFRHTLRASVWKRSPGGWQLFYHQATPTDESW